MSWFIQAIANKVNHPEFLEHNWRRSGSGSGLGFREYRCTKCGSLFEVQLTCEEEQVKGEPMLIIEFWEPYKRGMAYCGTDFSNTATCTGITMDEALG